MISSHILSYLPPSQRTWSKQSHVCLPRKPCSVNDSFEKSYYCTWNGQCNNSFMANPNISQQKHLPLSSHASRGGNQQTVANLDRYKLQNHEKYHLLVLLISCQQAHPSEIWRRKRERGVEKWSGSHEPARRAP